MKNPFKHFQKKSRQEAPPCAPDNTAPPAQVSEAPTPAPPVPPHDEPKPSKTAPPDDGFTEWRRTRARGGIERRERNDIFEAYSVFGADGDGRLTLRYYHRYPEHERDFGLSSSRALSFGDFNRRLRSELDQGGLTLADYHACIANAERLTDPDADGIASDSYLGFSEAEEAVLRRFCDAADILKDQRYLHSEGVLSCECGSAVGDDRLILRFRRPLSHDACGAAVPGVRVENLGGYDIDNLWIMGVYNRLRERCAACRVSRLTSEWSIEHESLWLFDLEDFEGVGGRLLAAVGEADSFRRFGFWSLDFSKK